jgi:hypothetical protein
VIDALLHGPALDRTATSPTGRAELKFQISKSSTQTHGLLCAVAVLKAEGGRVCAQAASSPVLVVTSGLRAGAAAAAAAAAAAESAAAEKKAAEKAARSGLVAAAEEEKAEQEFLLQQLRRPVPNAHLRGNVLVLGPPVPSTDKDLISDRCSAFTHGGGTCTGCNTTFAPRRQTNQKKAAAAAGAGSGSGGGGVRISPPPPGLTATLTSSRFASCLKAFKVGGRGKATAGIWHAMGIPENGTQHISVLQNGCEEIEREFKEHGKDDEDGRPDDGLGSDWERFAYVNGKQAQTLTQTNGSVRDAGANNGQSLDDFMKHPSVGKAGLTRAHVLALRLYTSNSFSCINQPLRDETQPHLFCATTFYIQDALRKLRSINADAVDCNEPRVFWRGLTDRTVPDNVMKTGGTELGCLSTTVSFDEALKWATPLLFKVVARDYMSWGVDVSWLSMYPAEEEWLFPPLMYLNFKGKEVTEKMEQVEVHPTWPS